MGRQRSPRATVEFGDFQTPEPLAAAVCRLLRARGVAPRSIVEPTCGVGNLLFAALDAFPSARRAHALDVNAAYVARARERLRGDVAATIEHASFFDHDWPTLIKNLPEPILVVGNPPWVTSADLGALRSDNLPAKRNADGLAGLDALTGKSNFDISEWMLTRLIGWLAGKRATLAVLCKTAVARKVLGAAWTAQRPILQASMARFDSAAHFGAAVDACLLVLELGADAGEATCQIHDDLAQTTPTGAFGLRRGVLVADAALYDRRQALIGESAHTWRSGIKHDCAAVMELAPAAFDAFENSIGERVQLERRYVFPMLKSSDLARDGDPQPRRWMLVPQSCIGEDTAPIAANAPATWHYLNRHRERLAGRASAIYRGRPPFSIFGVGDYTFAPWKVAISGLYKRLIFKVVGPHAGKPVVLDDTCYAIACASEDEARLLARLLASPPAQEFYDAFIFWDAKRPITTDILRRLDLRRLAAALGLDREYAHLSPAQPNAAPVGAKRRRAASAAATR